MTRPVNLFSPFTGLPLVGLGSFAVQTSIESSRIRAVVLALPAAHACPFSTRPFVSRRRRRNPFPPRKFCPGCPILPSRNSKSRQSHSHPSTPSPSPRPLPVTPAPRGLPPWMGRTLTQAVGNWSAPERFRDRYSGCHGHLAYAGTGDTPMAPGDNRYSGARIALGYETDIRDFLMLWTAILSEPSPCWLACRRDRCAL